MQDNGGPTKTIALQSTSPAIDKGKAFGATTDQRGEPRPHDFANVANASDGDGSDIGAFELQPPALLSIDDVNVTEGNSGTQDATFTVSLSRASTQTITVNYATSDGTATAGRDYVASSGTLTFAPGVTSKTVPVTVDEDNVAESDETFFVTLSSPTNATISDAQGQGTITNDDATTTPVAVDIKPTTCPNPLSTSASGTYPVAILGTTSFDVPKVDPVSVTLEGVSAQTGRQVTIKDVATPYSGTITNPPQANQCTTDGPDGKNDLNLKFDVKQVRNALGTVTNKQPRVVTLTGNLKAAYGGAPIEGQDVVVINKKK